MEQKSQDWHRADIKSALEKRGITLREFSRAAGLSPDSLRNVFTHNWPRARGKLRRTSFGRHAISLNQQKSGYKE